MSYDFASFTRLQCKTYRYLTSEFVFIGTHFLVCIAPLLRHCALIDRKVSDH